MAVTLDELKRMIEAQQAELAEIRKQVVRQRGRLERFYRAVLSLSPDVTLPHPDGEADGEGGKK